MTRDHLGGASDAVDEIVDGRIWSGIHFRNADEASVHIAERIAKYREKHYFSATGR